MLLTIPDDFKSGRYYFNKYRKIDLIILISGIVIGITIFLISMFIALAIKSLAIMLLGLSISAISISTVFLLTMNITHYHNVLEKIICMIHYSKSKKKYIWRGVIYDNQKNDEEI